MKTDKPIIMYDSPEAATYKTNIEGWISADGIFCGKGEQGERTARYRGATHTKCDCGNVIPMRSYTKCETCRNKISYEKYMLLPFKEYDGSIVCETDGDKYFFDEDDIAVYLEDNDLDEIDLLFATPNFLDDINTDIWCDVLPEEGEIPEVIQKAVNELNILIRKQGPISYSPGKIRTKYVLKSE